MQRFFYLFIQLLILLSLPIATAKAASIKTSMRSSTVKLAYSEVQLDLGSLALSQVEKPLNAALRVLLEPNDEPESPLNNALAVAAETDDSHETNSEVQLERARELLSRHFNRSTTQMVLLEDGKEGRGYAPEKGEDPKKYWIFSLVMPSLSDHIYWIVISRDDYLTAYVYGFN